MQSIFIFSKDNTKFQLYIQNKIKKKSIKFVNSIAVKQ